MHSTDMYLKLTKKEALYVIQCFISHTVIKLAISASLAFDLIKHFVKRKLIIVKKVMTQTSLDCLYNCCIILYENQIPLFIYILVSDINIIKQTVRRKCTIVETTETREKSFSSTVNPFYAKVTIKKKGTRCWIVKNDGFSLRYVLLYNCCVRLPFSQLAFHTHFPCVRKSLILHSFGLTDPLRSR